MDFTPTYLHQPHVASLLANMIPRKFHRHVRLAAILREPVARDLSWFNHRQIELYNALHGRQTDWNRATMHDFVNYTDYVRIEKAKWVKCAERHHMLPNSTSLKLYLACWSTTVLSYGMYAV